MTLLTDDEYAGGIFRIRGAVTNFEAAGEELIFTTDISLCMVAGRLEAG
jgi:hypothetical protein